MAVRVVCKGAWLARETRASVLQAKMTLAGAGILCARGQRTTNAAGGLLLSALCRRPHLDDRDGLVVTWVDDQEVKKL